MIHLRTLGALDLRAADGHEIRSVLVRPKRLALLLYLVLAAPRGYHRRDKLLALFWPECDESHARNALSQALHVLRRGLGEGVLVNRGDDEVGLAEGMLQCDAVAFEAALERQQLEEALELYRGDLLEGLLAGDAPEFERWIEEERARLKRLAVDSALALTAEEEAAGNLSLALQWSRRALALAPYDEAALRAQLRILQRQGNRTGALGAYEQFAARLAAELELEPSPGLRGWIEEIRCCSAEAEEPRGFAPETAAFPARPVAVAARPAPAGPPRARRGARPTRLLARGLAVLALAAVGIVAGREDQPELYQMRVAVAPFENLTGDSALDPIGRMAADWVTQGLTEADFLEVVDVQTALATSRELAEAGVGETDLLRVVALARETGAGTVISGTYYIHGDSLHFQAQVSDAHAGRLVQGILPASAPADSPLSAVAHLRDRVLASLADRLDPRLASFEADLSRPPSYEAYRAYAQGLEVFLTEDFAAAAESFDRASELDPAFLRALLWAAKSHLYVGATRSDTAHWVRADSAFRVLNAAGPQLSPYDRHHLDYVLAWYRGRDAALQAARSRAAAAPGSTDAVREAGYNAIRMGWLREGMQHLRKVDPGTGVLRGHDSYWLHLTYAHHRAGDHRRELKEARRARERDPHNIHRLRNEAVALAAMGRSDELDDLLDQVVEAASTARLTAGGVLAEAARELRTHGHAEQADAVVRRALAWHRGRPPGEASTRRARQELADALYLAGQWEEARAIYGALASEWLPSPRVLGRLGTIAARMGERERALEASALLATNARHWLGNPREEHTMARARIAATLGDAEQALLLLRQYGGPWGIDHADMDLESLWGDPRFQDLLRPKQ